MPRLSCRVMCACHCLCVPSVFVCVFLCVFAWYFMERTLPSPLAVRDPDQGQQQWLSEQEGHLRAGGGPHPRLQCGGLAQPTVLDHGDGPAGAVCACVCFVVPAGVLFFLSFCCCVAHLSWDAQNTACISVLRNVNSFSHFNFNSIGEERQKKQRAPAAAATEQA